MQTAPPSKFPVWSNRIPNSNGKIRKKKPIVCFGHTSFVSLKKTWQDPDVCQTVWDSHICHKTSQMITNLVWLVQSFKPLFFRPTCHTNICMICMICITTACAWQFDLHCDWPSWEDLAIESSNTVNYVTSSFLLYTCHPVATYKPRQIFWESCLGHEVRM